jgi:hypothetical protein
LAKSHRRTGCGIQHRDLRNGWGRQICSKVYSIQRFSEDEDVAVTRTHSGIDSLLNVSCPANPEILLTNGIDKRIDDECLLTGFVLRKIRHIHVYEGSFNGPRRDPLNRDMGIFLRKRLVQLIENLMGHPNVRFVSDDTGFWLRLTTRWIKSPSAVEALQTKVPWKITRFMKPVVGRDGCWRSFWNGGSKRGPISTTWNIQGWPTLYIVDGEGIIRHRFGFLESPAEEKVLDEVIDALVKESEEPQK